VISRKVFEGIKVAEFSWVVVGPSSSRYLADHGATVVKIESHNRLDTLKGMSPFIGGKPALDNSMCYGRHNSNKYGVSINMNNPGGIKLAWKLIMWADIVTESFTPRVMRKWGLDYENVRKVKPDVIYLSSSMQGGDGPHSSYIGYGPNACAISGFSEICGWPDQMPATPHGAYTDYICPRFNATALIAALEYRRRTGKGQWIEQSQVETSLHFISPPIMDYLVNGRVTSRDGNRLSYAAPHGIFPCRGKDFWIAIAVFNDEEWQALCSVANHPEWAQQSEFATLSRRKENEGELEKLISDWTKQYETRELEAKLQSAGIASSAVLKSSEAHEDPQLKYRDYFIRLDHPVMGKQAFEPQSCFILSKTPRELSRPSPCMGEHNFYIFKELLGMTDDEISDYLADGSLTTALPGNLQSFM
jgi:benzylsuccinate CoA-transferase BbsF subunit